MSDQLECNEQAVMGCYDLMFNQNKPREAVEYFERNFCYRAGARSG